MKKSLKKPLQNVLSKESKSKEYSLPVKKHEPSIGLERASILIYGKKKIGKTSLVNQFSENMLHMMFEPQARNLRLYQVPCVTHDDFVGYSNLLKSSEHNFDSVSIDTLPLLYERSLEKTCKTRGMEHPSGQNDFGMSWSFVNKDFNKSLAPLLQLDIGVFFHAHELEDEIETRSGSKYRIVRPEGGKQVWEFINANVENIWYYHLRGSKRFLQIRGDDYVTACTAWPDKFFTPSGEQIFAIPMGNSPEEGFKNIQKAFRNEQKETYKDQNVQEDTEQSKKSFVFKKRPLLRKK